MTVIDLVTFGPLLQQLDALDRNLADQRRYTEQLCESLALALFRRVVDASGVKPPALADFTWSPVVGTAEVSPT